MASVLGTLLAVARCAPSPLDFDESAAGGSAGAVTDAAADADACSLHRDEDGDGFAPVGAPLSQTCEARAGWVPARDANGDGEPDWDCDDADPAVFPGATDVCDGAVDQDCSGFADESCPEPCPGSWPVDAGDWVTPLIFDLNGDGVKEILLATQSSKNPGIRGPDGNKLSAGPPAANWHSVTFADMDGDFSVEVVQPQGIWERSGWTFTLLEGFGSTPNDRVYSAGVSDLNSDGNLDVVGYRCEDDSGADCPAGVVPPGSGCRPLAWMLRSRQPGALSGDLIRLPRPPGGIWAGCGAAPTSLDVDQDGIEEILFVQSHTNAPARDGRLHVYACQDPPQCASWSVKSLSTGHDDCGGWWDFHLWSGDADGSGKPAVFVPYSSGCDVSPAIDPLTGNELLGSVWLYKTGPADLDGNGRFDDTTDFASPLDLDGDGQVDVGRFEGDQTSAVLGGYVDGMNASAPWLPGWPKPNVRALVADDLDGDGRVEVITHDRFPSSQLAQCFRLGAGSWRPETLLGQMFTGLTPLQRNGKSDNFEPNDVVRWAADGKLIRNLATRYVLPPGHDLYRALISRPGDVDWYEASATKWTNRWSARLWVPDGKDYALAIGCEPSSKVGAPTAGVEPVTLAEAVEAERMRRGVWWQLDLGLGSANATVTAQCATSSRYFVKVWSRSGAQHGTRPYLLKVGN